MIIAARPDSVSGGAIGSRIIGDRSFMPFKLEISSVEYCGAEIAISGRLVEGAYAGPEAVIICGQDGTSITAPVIYHSLYLPQGWPVLPSNDTILTLSMSVLNQEDFDFIQKFFDRQ
jgi:hypothetical protein